MPHKVIALSVSLQLVNGRKKSCTSQLFKQRVIRLRKIAEIIIRIMT